MFNGTVKKSLPEESKRIVSRRVEAGMAANLNWEEKVLERVGEHVARLTEIMYQSADDFLGWEAAGFNALKNHSNAYEDAKE